MEPLEPLETRHPDIDTPPATEHTLAARANAEARKRRMLLLVLTAAVLAVVALACGGGYWYRDRQIATEREVYADLERAHRYRDKARLAKPGDWTDWANALAAVKQAQGRLAQGKAGAELTREVDQLAIEIEREQDSRLFATDLEETRLWTLVPVDGRGDSPRIAERYGKFFSDHKVDVRAAAVEPIVERLRLLAADDQVAAVLEDWVAHEHDDGLRKRLYDLVRRIDADPFRTDVRQTFASGTREHLEELAAKVQLDSLPASSLLLLAHTLVAKGVLTRAEAVLRQAQFRFPGDCFINFKLALLLHRPPATDETLRFFTAANAVRRDCPTIRTALGYVLLERGQREEAVREYREAVRLDPDYAPAHLNLGNLLAIKGEVDEAIREYRETLRCVPDHADAHCRLGLMFARQGKYADALAELKVGDLLGSKQAAWPLPSGLWVKQAEQRVALDARLPAILKGDDKPADADEQRNLAEMCQQHKHLYAAAARFYAEALAAQPKLGDDLASAVRYNAACVAVLAANGQGEDSAKLDEPERVRLRRQALAWLNADLALWTKQALRDDAKAREAVLVMMRHWQQDKDFVSVREREGLEKMPEEERQGWRNLWDEVEALRNKIAPK